MYWRWYSETFSSFTLWGLGPNPPVLTLFEGEFIFIRKGRKLIGCICYIS